jgi:hypothetical protein
MDPTDKSEKYNEAEIVRRREAALNRMLATPHKPHRPLKKAKLSRPKQARPQKKDRTV